MWQAEQFNTLPLGGCRWLWKLKKISVCLSSIPASIRALCSTKQVESVNIHKKIIIFLTNFLVRFLFGLKKVQGNSGLNHTTKNIRNRRHEAKLLWLVKFWDGAETPMKFLNSDVTFFFSVLTSSWIKMKTVNFWTLPEAECCFHTDLTLIPESKSSRVWRWNLLNDSRQSPDRKSQ